ncbi:SRPBCC family protein [Albimonas sp. CAU 1670]|uniref:SRPBCC family protein n=1 Tax=Albimonas sp. CAU 1670 TaxID=3032599 RepID=UPI0023DC1177|nr:SRPBCC family protein [Albimonas sp. CAU 1670]MDF2231676.1 SRPBCC family protein [Albimonas sp. CAU 1670]
MPEILDAEPASARELVIRRRLAAPPAALWRCWTEAPLLERWFCPTPWRATDAVLDVRPGGVSSMVMRGPDGESFPNEGVYLEVVPPSRLVFTDAFRPGWEIAENPFFVGLIEFEADGAGGTIYTARARHFCDEGCERHKAMGFHDGWGAAAAQLEEVARTLPEAAA